MAADRRATRHDQGGGREDPPQQDLGHEPDQQRHAKGGNDPDHQVLQGVDVLDHPGQQVSLAEGGQAGRGQSLQPLVDPAPGGRLAAGTRRRGPLAAPGSGRSRGRARRTARPTMARASWDSFGCWAAFEISQAAVANQADVGGDGAGTQQGGEDQPTGGRSGDGQGPAQRCHPRSAVTAVLGRRSRTPPPRPAPVEPRGRPRQQRGPVGHDDHRAAHHQPAHRGQHASSVRPSRPAVGSSSRSSGESRTKARASATRCRSPAESPAPSWPRTVSSPSGSAATTSSRPASAMAARDGLVGGVGPPEADVGGDRPGEQMGPLGNPGDVGPP